MRILCVTIPCFYVQVRRLRDGRLRGVPVVIGGRPEKRALVVDCSKEAARSGVAPAIPLKEAYHLCPEAVFVPFERDDYEEVWEEMLSSLASFTLRIAAEGCGTAYLDITRSWRFFGTEQGLAARVCGEVRRAFGLDARTGVANGRFVARMAAGVAGPEGRVVPAGGEKGFLAPFDTGLLPVSREIRERLRLFGLLRFGQIAAIPLDALISQFGGAGRNLWMWVHGEGERDRIPPRYTATCIRKEAECDGPAETIGALMAPLDRVVDDLSRELEVVGAASRRIKLAIVLQDRDIVEMRCVTHLPVASKGEIMRRLVASLGGLALKSPARGLILYAFDLSPRGADQWTLFREKARRARAFGTIRGYLRAKYRAMPLMRVEERDSGTRLPERRFLFTEL